jgi:hypothetical protein
MLVSLRLPGYRCANDELRRPNPHPESTAKSGLRHGNAHVPVLGHRGPNPTLERAAKSASVPGNARVPVLGQHGPNRHQERAAKSASVPGNARVRLLGQHGYSSSSIPRISPRSHTVTTPRSPKTYDVLPPSASPQGNGRALPTSGYATSADANTLAN